MSFKEQGLDEKDYLANAEKLSYLAYEDQCSPANPKLPLVDDMMKILQDTFDIDTTEYVSLSANLPRYAVLFVGALQLSW